MGNLKGDWKKVNKRSYNYGEFQDHEKDKKHMKGNLHGIPFQTEKERKKEDKLVKKFLKRSNKKKRKSNEEV